MKQKDKELLLKDLCSRLPYGVWVLVHDTFKYSTVPFEKVYLKSPDISSLIDSISLNERYNNRDKRFNRIIKERKDFLEFKPYLFPLSSMTEEQKKEYNSLKHEVPVCRYEYGDVVEEVILLDSPESLEYLIKNRFDHNGFIETGSAIDCTNLNIY